ncbi:eukaryotic aspartyl protease family protein [Wolffia australiana]
MATAAKLVILLMAMASVSGTTTTTTTEILDVVGELRKATAAIAADFKERAAALLAEAADDGGAAMAVRVHPRQSVIPSSHKDYKSLTLDRLDRDEKRVRSIQSRLDLAVRGVTRSDLKPMAVGSVESVKSVQGLSGEVVSGTSQGSGEYFSRIGIGTPAKSQYMVIDTGSDVTWAQCQPCADCYEQSDPVFDPAGSASFEPVGCSARQCRELEVSACHNGSCLYQVSYGDGSYTVGELVTEMVTLGGAAVPRVAFGCGHDNEGLFVGAAGLLGLGGGALSFPSQLAASSFSYCLVDRDSAASSTLEFGNSPFAAAAVAAPLLRNRRQGTFYYLGLAGISVGGRMLSVPSASFAMDEAGGGGVIVDSGTAVTRLHTQAYEALRNAFRAGTMNLLPAMGVALFDTCYNLALTNSVAVPAIALHFPGGKSLRLPAKNYLIPVDNMGTFCLAFAPTSSGLSIIGNVQQQGTRVSFDLANSLVSFSPNQC